MSSNYNYYYNKYIQDREYEEYIKNNPSDCKYTNCNHEYCTNRIKKTSNFSHNYDYIKKNKYELQSDSILPYSKYYYDYKSYDDYKLSSSFRSNQYYNDLKNDYPACNHLECYMIDLENYVSELNNENAKIRKLKEMENSTRFKSNNYLNDSHLNKSSNMNKNDYNSSGFSNNYNNESIKDNLKEIVNRSRVLLNKKNNESIYGQGNDEKLDNVDYSSNSNNVSCKNCCVNCPNCKRNQLLDKFLDRFELFNDNLNKEGNNANSNLNNNNLSKPINPEKNENNDENDVEHNNNNYNAYRTNDNNENKNEEDQKKKILMNLPEPETNKYEDNAEELAEDAEKSSKTLFKVNLNPLLIEGNEPVMEPVVQPKDLINSGNGTNSTQENENDISILINNLKDSLKNNLVLNKFKKLMDNKTKKGGEGIKLKGKGKLVGVGESQNENEDNAEENNDSSSKNTTEKERKERMIRFGNQTGIINNNDSKSDGKRKKSLSKSDLRTNTSSRDCNLDRLCSKKGCIHTWEYYYGDKFPQEKEKSKSKVQSSKSIKQI